MRATFRAVSHPSSSSGPRYRWLPAIGTWKFHALMIVLGICILGPLGGVSAAFMNFSIGFFVGGQVLAGILGSTVTYGYGPDGKHAANYMQTAAASVAGLSGMAVLIQAMVWLGAPELPAWQMVLYLLCIGMFGVGVGMLYTPILVDRLKLTYPSGLAVANILRALTDPRLLRQSVAKLGGGTLLGVGGGLASFKIAFLETIGMSTSTIGAGMIVGARITLPALVTGLICWSLTPFFVSIGWLHEGDQFRKITFVIALGMIMGAAVVDLAVIAGKAVQRVREARAEAEAPEDDWKKTNIGRLLAWCAFWGAGVLATGYFILDAPILFLGFALVLVFVFVMVNGISLGISDSNPISSAFVVTVLLFGTIGIADLGLEATHVALVSAAIVFVATSVACDMQQDRSTGWRLGTNRTIQFRYQVVGVVMGAIVAVVLAKLFMSAYPVLSIDQTATVERTPEETHALSRWTSAMTFKMVGAIRSLNNPSEHIKTAIWIGVAMGFATEVIRKVVKWLPAYQRFVKSGKVGFAVDFAFDAVIMPSPYASSFGGFVPLPTSIWFGIGGIVSSLFNTFTAASKPAANDATPSAAEHVAEGSELPEDMSTMSLIGGGLIAGDSLAALAIGVYGLIETLTS